MIDDADGIAAALSGTALAGLPVYDGPAGTLVVPDVGGDGLIDAWRVARSMVPVTGRWPLVVEEAGQDIVDIPGQQDPADFAGLDFAARKFDPWTGSGSDDEPFPAADWPAVLQALPAGLGEEAAGALGTTTTRPVLGRWVYDRLLAEPALLAPMRSHVDYLIGTRYWFRPRTVQLVLLPTDLSWLAPYWIDYWGAGQDSTWLSAVQWQWHDRWGAELVTSWGTMLEFFVSHPPEPGPQAWDLAGQILRVGGSLQMEQWILALALPQTGAWHLHDRP